MRVADPASVADAVEEFEDVDGDFASATNLVAQWGGAGARDGAAEISDRLGR